MLSVSKYEIESRLKDNGYSENEAKLVSRALYGIRDELVPSFEAWWKNTDYPEIEVGGYNLIALMNKFEMNPIAAILTLDWLLNEPEAANKAIKEGIK